MRWKELLFTGFYTGYCPVAPGTAGTLLALGIYYIEYVLFGPISWIANLIFVLAMLYPSIKLGDAGEVFFKEDDPPGIVLDEMMGFWIAVLFFPFSWKAAITAFLLFRAADIFKPYPVNRMQNLKGGLGVMMDDYIAGVYANLGTLLIGYTAGLAGMQFF